ncbi:MAG: hypothetical protein NVS4B3_06710 [Gemmatimonadaceae bacterium]
MGGRVTDVAGIPSPSKTFFVATAGGGIWKTMNAGTTFRPVFDGERVVSMGALAIAPSDTNVIYAGTGEQNSRNSISPGGGLYKSADGGATWKLMGLERTEQIARIVVDPRDARIVYVAALGHAWGPNPERGLYKTLDGGENWQLIKFVSDRAGFVDIAMVPNDPNTLYASSYERVRGPWFLQSGGPGSALWKSADAGKTWREIRGGGFPATTKGRINIAVARGDPRIVYAVVEADSIRGTRSATPAPASDSAAPTPRQPQRQSLLNGLYRSSDGGATWRWMNDRNVRPFYYSQVRVDPRDANRVYWSSTPFNFSDDGGKTVRNGTIGVHVDHHAMWIDPNDPAHFIVGNDGGVAQTWDRGGNYDFMNQFTIAQFYEVSFDMAVPYRVCGGLQDNGSWCGPSRKRNSGITNADWFTVGGGDGFYTAQDPTDPTIIYAESQGGNISRLNITSGVRTGLVRPGWRPRYLQLEDSILIARGDTNRPAGNESARRIADLRARQRADSGDLSLRFNWNTPFIVSPHAPATLYVGANRVLKSTSHGEGLFPISPDLTRHDAEKIHVSMETTGGITKDATGAETYATITTLAESPMRPGLLYAGTDDGNVWLTRNDGGSWENLSGRFPGVPAQSYVVRIEPSHFDSATFYVAFDNHRVNDFAPYLYVTSDFGRTFRSLTGTLPRGGPDFLHVVREDVMNRDLLFVGTDVALYVSLDRGTSWQRFMTGLPTVPVHDLKIHPRDHELIAATHGRGIWIADIAPLEQLTDSVQRQVAHLFAPKVAYQYPEMPAAEYSAAQKSFEAPSPPYGAHISYRVGNALVTPAVATAHLGGGDTLSHSELARTATVGRGRDTVTVVITNVRGDTVRSLGGPASPGIHTVVWDFHGRTAPSVPLTPAGKRDSIVTSRKMDAVFDSLAIAGVAPRPALDRIRLLISSGTGIGELLRRPRGTGAGKFAARPGEGALPKAPSSTSRPDAGLGAVTGGGGSPTGGDAGPDMEVISKVLEALRAAKLMQGGLEARRGSPTVDSGDYLVTLTAAGRTMRQVLRVERISGAGASATAGDDDEQR